MQDLIDIIDKGFATGARMDTDAENRQLSEAVQHAITMLDRGEARVAERVDGE